MIERPLGRTARVFRFACFAALAAIVLWDRLQVLRQFNFKYFDEDQSLLWFMARDFAAGHVREPCFPGQPYGTALEAYLAAPLTYFHFPLWIVLPAVTTALSLFPFYLWTRLVHRAGSFVGACAVLAIPAVWATKYGALSSMPRGFAPALFLCTLAFALLQSSRVPVIALGAALMVHSFTLNEATLQLSLPYALYLLMTRWRDRPFLRAALIGIAAGACVHGLTRAFYMLHPDYLLHPAAKFSFDRKTLDAGFARFDDFFSPVSPMGKVRWLKITSVALLLFVVATRHIASIVIAVAWAAGTLLTLGIDKVVRSGDVSMYLNLGRFFLALPLCLAFLIFLAARHSRITLPRTVAFIGAAAIVGGSAWAVVRKHSTLKADVDAMVAERSWWESGYPVTDAEKICGEISHVTAGKSDPLVVFREHRALAYACGAMLYGDVETIFPPYERRTWLLHREDETPRRRFFYYSTMVMPCGRFISAGEPCMRVANTLDLSEVVSPFQPALKTAESAGLDIRKFKPTPK